MPNTFKVHFLGCKTNQSDALSYAGILQRAGWKEAAGTEVPALTIVQTQFKIGSTDSRFVEQRQLSVTTTRSALIRMQAEQRIQRINLHLALGGSFEFPPAPPTTK